MMVLCVGAVDELVGFQAGLVPVVVKASREVLANR